MGLSIVNSSSAGTVESNNFDRNNWGMELAGSGTVTTFTSNTLGADRLGGIVRQNFTVSNFSNNKVRNNRGSAPSFQVSTANINMSNSETKFSARIRTTPGVH